MSTFRVPNSWRLHNHVDLEAEKRERERGWVQLLKAAQTWTNPSRVIVYSSPTIESKPTLESLPIEQHIQILLHVPDLHSLRSVTLSSNASYQAYLPARQESRRESTTGSWIPTK
ncbi:hypothetical protein BDW75DRAFT_243456 [Aspergillus navahoensis]